MDHDPGNSKAISGHERTRDLLARKVNLSQSYPKAKARRSIRLSYVAAAQPQFNQGGSVSSPISFSPVLSFPSK